MPLQTYLAMTAAEFDSNPDATENIAWMACQFSNSGEGLSNLPHRLPPNAMVMLNDRIPPTCHNPKLILKQLYDLYDRLKPRCFLLDFQRPGIAKNAEIAKKLCSALPCPIGISQDYAADLDCPVFLPPPPLHKQLEDYLRPWRNREIWLETTAETQTVTVTAAGSGILRSELFLPETPIFTDPELCCSYHTDIYADKVVFTLFRSADELLALQDKARACGVSVSVGFYMELKQPGK